jgi:hypothetical protein
MSRALCVVVMLAACVSGPAPKAPDESHRVPVNQMVPPEVAPDGASEKAARKAKAHGDGAKVEWR